MYTHLNSRGGQLLCSPSGILSKVRYITYLQKSATVRTLTYTCTDVCVFDQELIPYRYSSCSSCCFACSCWVVAHRKKSLRLRRFKSDRDEIWQDLFLKLIRIDLQSPISVLRRSFKMVALMPLQFRSPLCSSVRRLPASAGCPLAHRVRVTSVPDP